MSEKRWYWAIFSDKQSHAYSGRRISVTIVSQWFDTLDECMKEIMKFDPDHHRICGVLRDD